MTVIFIKQLALHKAFMQNPGLDKTVVTVALHSEDGCSLPFNPTISVRDVSFDIFEQLGIRVEFVRFSNQKFM